MNLSSNEMMRIWKDTAKTYFKVVFQPLFENYEENDQCTGRDRTVDLRITESNFWKPTRNIKFNSLITNFYSFGKTDFSSRGD
jgi:hypothetical protein